MQNPKYLLAISLPTWEDEMYWNEELFEYWDIPKIEKYIWEATSVAIEVVEPNYWDWVFKEWGDWNYEDYDWKWRVIGRLWFTNIKTFLESHEELLWVYFK